MKFFLISFDIIWTEEKNMFEKFKKSLVSYDVFVHKEIPFPSFPKSPFVRFKRIFCRERKSNCSLFIFVHISIYGNFQLISIKFVFENVF